MRLGEIVETSRRVAEASSRLEKIEHLAHCLRHADPAEIETAVAFLSGKLPQGRIGIGPARVRDAMPGPAAGPPALALSDVEGALDRLSRASGPGSAAERERLLRELLGRATREEQTFLVRLVLGELRQGALEGLMVEAVARAGELSAAGVRRALMLEGDLGRVARAALVEGVPGLERFAIAIFRPLKPMLASPAEDVAEAVGQLGRAAFEFKLDGARVQVHKAGSDVRIFTRRGAEVSDAVPEIVDAVACLPVREVILDGETLTFRADGRPHAFQTTMRRFGRKLDVASMRETLPLRSYFFDCLHLDGQSLIDHPGDERFAVLSEALPAEFVIPRTVTEKPGEAEAFLRESLRRGHEGLMAKSLRAPYAAGSRGREWLKVKPAHTLDLVVLGAEWGHGRRRDWLSNLHLGARDPSEGSFVMLGKTFKGMTDEMLAWQTRRLLDLEIGRDAYTVYVRPELVVEVAIGGVQASPHYPGGLALRFARVKRYRPDKKAEDADTIETVRSISETQVAD